MAYINAQNNNWDLEKDLNFEVIKNLDGAVKGLTDGVADYFMWEHFTTKPLVDRGVFRRIADCPTPWPCFVIAVRDEILANNLEDVKKVLNIINAETLLFKQKNEIGAILATRYQQKIEDIKEWLKITEWNAGKPITQNLIARIQNKMISLNVLDEKKNANEFIKNIYL